MKKTLLIWAIAIILPLNAAAWGRIGHATVAQVACNHISDNTAAALAAYMGGQEMTSYSSDADKLRYEWYRDLGCVVNNSELLYPGKTKAAIEELRAGRDMRLHPWCHSFSVDENFDCYHYTIKDSVYLRNCVYDLDGIIEDLRANHASMDSLQRSIYIRLVVHLVGDMHCPMHTLFVPKAPTGGKITVSIDTTRYGLHALWDNKIFALLCPGMDFQELAPIVDDCDDATRKEISQGSVYDWGKASAGNVWPANLWQGELLVKDQMLPAEYAETLRPILYHQLRDAGYRLAAALDYIFDHQ